MIYVARQNLISPVLVDLNCGKTASRAPPDWIFPPLPSVLGVFWQYGATESRKKIKTFNSAGCIEHRRWLERIYVRSNNQSVVEK